jgi:hypothetical protein
MVELGADNFHGRWIYKIIAKEEEQNNIQQIINDNNIVSDLCIRLF